MGAGSASILPEIEFELNSNCWILKPSQLVNNKTINWLFLDQVWMLIQTVRISKDHSIHGCCVTCAGERWKRLLIPDSVPMMDLRNDSLKSSSINCDFIWMCLWKHAWGVISGSVHKSCTSEGPYTTWSQWWRTISSSPSNNLWIL